jgi:isoquinoline 1-oxidoreductase subunit beta
MKIAVAQASPIIGGKLAGMDEKAALAVTGVRKVVRFDETVAVIADHTGAARKGIAALNPQWEGGAATYSTADLVGDLDKAIAGKAVVATNEGDFKNATSAAAKTLEARYESPLLAHATMEPMTCTARITADGCDIWVGTQVITRVQSAVAEATGLPAARVRVHNFLMGGAFGRRLETDYAVQAAMIAKQVDFPVKVIWTREEDFQHDVFRPLYVDKLSAGLDANGIPTAFWHRVAASSVMARWAPPGFVNGLDPDAVDGAAGPYNFRNQLIEYSRSEPPKGLVTGWWRGVGVTHNCFPVESFIDEMAGAAGKDPVEFRRLLLADSPRAKAVLDLAAEKAGWGTPMPAGKGRGVSLIELFGTHVAEVAEVSVDAAGDVRLDRVVCAVDCGRVVNPSAQGRRWRVVSFLAPVRRSTTRSTLRRGASSRPTSTPIGLCGSTRPRPSRSILWRATSRPPAPESPAPRQSPGQSATRSSRLPASDCASFQLVGPRPTPERKP